MSSGPKGSLHRTCNCQLLRGGGYFGEMRDRFAMLPRRRIDWIPANPWSGLGICVCHRPDRQSPCATHNLTSMNETLLTLLIALAMPAAAVVVVVMVSRKTATTEASRPDPFAGQLTDPVPATSPATRKDQLNSSFKPRTSQMLPASGLPVSGNRFDIVATSRMLIPTNAVRRETAA